MQTLSVSSIQEALAQGDLAPTYTLWQELRPIWKRWQNRTHLPGLDKDDLEQQSYLILLEALEKYHTDSTLSFYGYYKIRLHIWRARVAKKYTPFSASDTQLAEALLETPSDLDLQQQVEDHHLAQLIHQAIQELPPHECTLLTLSILQQQSADQIGETLGLTPHAIRKRKERTLTKLKKTLSSHIDC